MAFVRRRIDVTFALGLGSFGESGFNTVKLTGLRTSVHIQKIGAAMAELNMRIFGLDLSTMSELTATSPNSMYVRDNRVRIEAGDDDAGMAVVFQGTLNAGWANLGGSPEVYYQCSALSGLFAALKPVSPTSFNGGVDVALVMSGLATQMGLGFVNFGVSVQIASPYLAGTARMQAETIARAANIEWDDSNGVLAIWPKNGSRGAFLPTISAASGMKGYPVFTGQGIAVETIYRPGIEFGQLVRVESDLKPASGEWTISLIEHTLESEMPGGAWFTRFEGFPRFGTAPAK